MKRRRPLPLLWLALLLFIAGLICLGVTWRHWRALHDFADTRIKNYSDKTIADTTGLYDGTPIEEMPLSQLEPLLKVTDIGYTTTQYASGVSTQPVKYYAQPDENSEVVYELPADCVIHPRSSYAPGWGPIGYGFSSYPTYDPGWRYVRPFQADFTGTLNSYESGTKTVPEDLPYCYVRTEDLVQLIYDLMLPNYGEPQAEQLKKRGITLEEALAFTYVLDTDARLCAAGIYTSPDLYPPFTLGTAEIVLFSIAAAFLLLQILFRPRRRRRRPPAH